MCIRDRVGDGEAEEKKRPEGEARGEDMVREEEREREAGEGQADGLEEKANAREEARGSSLGPEGGDGAVRHRREDDEDERGPAEGRPSRPGEEPERRERESEGGEKSRGTERPDARVATRSERGVEEEDGRGRDEEGGEGARVGRDRDVKRREPRRGPGPLEDVAIEREEADEDFGGAGHWRRLQAAATSHV